MFRRHPPERVYSEPIQYNQFPTRKQDGVNRLFRWPTPHPVAHSNRQEPLGHPYDPRLRRTPDPSPISRLAKRPPIYPIPHPPSSFPSTSSNLPTFFQPQRRSSQVLRRANSPPPRGQVTQPPFVPQVVNLDLLQQGPTKHPFAPPPHLPQTTRSQGRSTTPGRPGPTRQVIRKRPDKFRPLPKMNGKTGKGRSVVRLNPEVVVYSGDGIPEPQGLVMSPSQMS
ncbi:hypothetical protein FA13DRAFT_658835 [Coprinellus micaceus]|jgi:hypothetical protein|uniref:Uncharacterized protein n=1 Tax=Coprinellus micaceus TaxID=71717 RepID=A0A4Y7S9U7_COPMI|nr:hypothetical protein FA13DRAFT_658835 [Coprinellus micaceus]